MTASHPTRTRSPAELAAIDCYYHRQIREAQKKSAPIQERAPEVKPPEVKPATPNRWVRPQR